ncbi:M6 family metalloprotease domain-containing protein OS=Streptomyces microflavus OX=1919 GN=G3I39_02305 PE=4 SV=1 [Streptomyces microflavus]
MLSGQKVTTRSGSKVVKLGDKKYVELGREKTDKIFTILLEFGDQVDDTTLFYLDGDGPELLVKKFGEHLGLAHNKIAKPAP